MSTPIEIACCYTEDSVFVDEYGLCSISVQSKDHPHFAELDLDGVLELIEQLTRAAQEMVRKERRDYE